VAEFIGQNKGFFFRKCYKVATIFVDHFSRLSYVYLQESIEWVQTLAAKRLFEAYSSSYRVKVQQYHADIGRTSLLHAIHMWPSAVTINLWPYALLYINEVYNATPALKTGKSPLEAFSQTAIRPKILDFHPPFCPGYALHNGLQSGGSRPNKLVRQSRVAINLGQSP
jgi:hypothetical protein